MDTQGQAPGHRSALDAARPPWTIVSVTAPHRYPLSSAQIAAISSAADVSTRSVRRYLRGAGMHASSLRRLAAALEAAGLGAHVRPVPAVPAQAAAA